MQPLSMLLRDKLAAALASMARSAGGIGFESHCISVGAFGIKTYRDH